MPARRKIARKHRSSVSGLEDRAATFFGTLAGDAAGRRLLSEQSHRIEFDLSERDAFYVQIKKGRIAIRTGEVQPRRFDINDLIHFQVSARTLTQLFDGKIRFTDALIPSEQQAGDSMVLLECTLFKWSVLSWVGRLFRGAQVRSRCAA